MAKFEKIDKNGNKAIIKFISDNCGVCTDEHKKIYENCENCYFLKTFLENKGTTILHSDYGDFELKS